MRNGAVYFAIGFLAMSGAASAQNTEAIQSRTLLLPGSVNASVGTLVPGERGNVLSSVTTEQGFTPFRIGRMFVVGFANVGVRHDTDGLPWNRAVPATAGIKFVTMTRGGMFQGVVGAHAYVRDDVMDVSKAVYATYWHGWRGDIGSARSIIAPAAFPGYAYGSTGLVTAAEPDNWITSVSLQQGVTVLRYRGTSLIPFVGASGGVDTAGYNWNNRARLDGGVKVTREVLSGVIDIGMAHRRELDHLTGTSRTAPVVFVNFWLGWSPAVGAAR
jgi:hypothetical protein